MQRARFLSLDHSSGSIGDPQSLNLYPYVRDDPTDLADPSGNIRELVRTEELMDCENGGTDCAGVGVFDSTYGVINPYFAFATINFSGYSAGDTGYDSGSIDYTQDLIGGVGIGGVGVGGGGGDLIGDTLKKLQKLLKLDPNCSSFLSSKGTNVQTELSGIIDNQLYGQTEIPPTPSGPNAVSMTNAVSFGYIPGQAITVNTIGAFFNSTYNNMPLTTDRGKSGGGTPAAQGFILLHELGQLTDVLKPDFNNQAMVDQNDKAIEGHCKDLIKTLSM